MKWVRYQENNGVFYGLLSGDIITQVNGSPFTGYESTDQEKQFDAVRILPPVIPKTFYAAGINYKKHVLEAAALLNREPNLPEKADIGYRANNAIIGHGDPIVIPKDATDKIHYEAELVVVIGKTAKNVSMQDALKYVLGYTVGNDVSERTWQASDRTLWRAKNTDTFKPMGPWIETEAPLAFDLALCEGDDVLIFRDRTAHRCQSNGHEKSNRVIFSDRRGEQTLRVRWRRWHHGFDAGVY